MEKLAIFCLLIACLATGAILGAAMQFSPYENLHLFAKDTAP